MSKVLFDELMATSEAYDRRKTDFRIAARDLRFDRRRQAGGLSRAAALRRRRSMPSSGCAFSASRR